MQNGKREYGVARPKRKHVDRGLKRDEKRTGDHAGAGTVP